MVRTIPFRPRWLAAALVVAGCTGNGKAPETPKDGAVDPAPAPVPTAVPPAPVQTPQELYAACMERVENPQADGECKTDADCATTGCGGEVCSTVANKPNVTTTCEDKLCFKVLDVCGCHEGHCTWTLKAEAPKAPMPSGLPMTAPDNKGEKAAEPAPAPAAPAP
jgi:eight-cysteine-cluster-containing protein